MTEKILQENPNRYVLFPIKYPDIWELYKKQKECFWEAEEISLSNDIVHWKSLTENERYFLKHILAFFAASDGIVSENLCENMISEIQVPEAKMFYGFQNMMENIHSECYSLMIDTYINNESEKDVLFNAIHNFPAIGKKANWAINYIQNGTFQEKLVAFAAVEGIFFSGSFCSIFYMKERELLPGLCAYNELISRDENQHAEFAIYLYNKHIENKLAPETLRKILLDALEIEKEFITEALPVSLIGMNDNLMSKYLEYVTDLMLVEFGQKPEFNTPNPFSFMKRISLFGKNNFFERNSTEYQRGTASLNDVKFDEEF